MSRRKEPRGSVHGGPTLKTCETCGEKGIAHTESGRPYQAHLRGLRHREAVKRRSAEPAADAARGAAQRPEDEGDEDEGPEPIALSDHEARG